ncbi:MAG: hypothetical protein QXP98_05115 [Thermoproteus sp.]
MPKSGDVWVDIVGYDVGFITAEATAKLLKDEGPLHCPKRICTLDV